MLARIVGAFVVVLLIAGQAGASFAGDEHWSFQFKKPRNAQSMTPATGMADGNSKPVVNRVKWHNGKLWMAGIWSPGVSALDMSKRQQNESWHLWSWSPEAGYEVYSYFHSQNGGAGPDNQIDDFLFLPDGRIVVGGAFQRVANLTGTRYHRVNGIAVYDPKEPTANKWRPLGSFQYNGTVSSTGSVHAIAYDPKSNDLFIGGTFAGILMDDPAGGSPKIHRYDFDTESYEPMSPGVNGVKAYPRRIKVDTSTTPSTVYVSGRFQYTGGNGLTPAVSESTARYSPGFASWQEGRGWTTFPTQKTVHHEDTLQRAADFMHFDSVHVLDFLVDGEDIWIVGGFSGGKDSGETLRGIAKWDAAGQKWIDPTGKGGVGREVWSIGKADNGKIYFAGAFGGRVKGQGYFEGFKNGDPAYAAMSYDPATGEWAQLGSGLATLVFPEVRMTVAGNDVYFAGDFRYIGTENEAKKNATFESHYIARWNDTIDFTKQPAKPAQKATLPAASQVTEVALSDGNEFWSRRFAPPPRRKNPDTLAHTGKTGMDAGTGPPDTVALGWLDDTLYFAGNYPATPNERWYAWSYHAERGWEKLGWDALGESIGPDAAPLGMKIHDSKVWVFGGLPNFKGIAIYDPATKEWSPFKGTWNGQPVIGHAVQHGGGVIRDIAWDSKTGDTYIVGASGLENKDDPYPGDVAKVMRIDKDGAYHFMGHDIKVEDPNKPKQVFQTIYLDETKTPTDIYIGGTFAFNGPTPTKTDMRVYNIAKWDHQINDWGPIGSGIKTAPVDEKHFPKGYPGLPHRADLFGGFLQGLFPHVRDITMDGKGRLYAVGTLAVLDFHTLPVKDRKETYGIARWDPATDRWEGATNTGGFSRDPIQMTWLDAERSHLLLTGAFEYGNDWQPLNGVAILDTNSGDVKPLGGGLMMAHRDQVVAPMVRHTVRGSELWFAGLFDHAGINANATFAAPIPASYVAVYDPTKSADPNAGLVVKPIAPLPAPTSSSKAYKITLEAQLDGDGVITWYQARSGGKFAKVGTGPKFNANPRAKRSDTEIVFYVSVVGADGTEGGKIPVRIPLVK